MRDGRKGTTTGRLVTGVVKRNILVNIKIELVTGECFVDYEENKSTNKRYYNARYG